MRYEELDASGLRDEVVKGRRSVASVVSECFGRIEELDGGLGVFLVRKLMDAFHYRRDGEFNRLYFAKSVLRS